MKKVTVLLTALALILGLCACAKSAGATTWQEQYDLGVRYLSEGKYEEAVIAFQAAIEIDPKQADAYIGLADAYEAMGDVEKARQLLADALAVVADADAIQSRLDGLGESANPEPTPGATVEPTPTHELIGTVVASGECGDNVAWTLDSNGLLTISGAGSMGDYEQGAAPWYGERDSMAKVIIEDGITSIGGFVFFECSNLTGVAIPNGVANIGEYAFGNCGSLTSVTIPDSVTSIGQGAFGGCYRLASVTIPNNVTNIGDGAFTGCSSLTSVTIPDNVTSIGRTTFWYCTGLTSVTIPDSVTSIGAHAFRNCDSLTDVYYSGNEAQWHQISVDNIEDANSALLNATIHYNS